MSIERIYYCDGPANPDIPGGHEGDRCPHNARAAVVDENYVPGGMLRVTQNVQGQRVDELHFCSWDCVLRYAGARPPVEYIALDESSDS